MKYVLLVIIMLLTCYFPFQVESFQIKNENINYENIINGQILYSPMWSTTTYLIDRNGNVNNTWYSNYFPGVSVWWVGDGSILRTIRLSGSPGGGGGVQKIAMDGTILWDFRYNNNGVLSHHDVKSLPNGNVLLIAWEHKTRSEAINAGRDPNYVSSSGLWPDHIIEVKPTGLTTGDIVWQWHMWDHLIQDFDSSKPNYGKIENHPELIDINYGQTSQVDFMHTNSIDYNENLDQILISVCYFNEIWVIDHSTTALEATGHTGGNSGHGGDLLYRWGNPNTYKRGTSADQKLFFQHDATWVDEGNPGEGNILIFNNGINYQSSVDEITPPIDENGNYIIEEGYEYGPTEKTWSYYASNFWVGQFGGAIRLVNGDTLITNGETGLLFEVAPNNEIVWQLDTSGQLFKAVFIPLINENQPFLNCEGSLQMSGIKSGTTLDGNFVVKNIGDNDSLLNWKIESYPDWGTWTFNPESGENLKPKDGNLTIQLSLVVPSETNKKFEGNIKIINQDNPNNFDIIPVFLKTTRKINTFDKDNDIGDFFEKIVGYYVKVQNFGKNIPFRCNLMLPFIKYLKIS